MTKINQIRKRCVTFLKDCQEAWKSFFHSFRSRRWRGFQQFAKLLERAAHFRKRYNEKFAVVDRQLLFYLRMIKRRLMPRRFRSVKFEISVIYTLILGFILITFSSVFYVITSRTLNQQLDNELQIKAEGVVENISSYLQAKGEQPHTLEYAAEQTIAREDKTLRRWWYIGFERSWFRKLDEQDLSEDYVNFVALDNTLNVTSKNLNQDLIGLFRDNVKFDRGKNLFWNINTNNQDIRVINHPYPSAENPTHLIQVGISKGPINSLLKKWMISVWVSIPVILILTAFIGQLLASRILRPLDKITYTATNISYENLNLRVEPKLHYTEMDYLIRTFNDMLGRLEKSFKHIDEFSTHVAHELKTPLAIIRGEAELSYYSAKSKENKKSLKVMIEEIDKMLKTVEDLLFLGKTRYQPESFKFADIYLNDFLSEIIEQYKMIAMDKDVEFDFTIPKQNIPIRADELHLRRLFFNLLDNAIKYTPEKGRIMVGAYIKKGKVYINITDTGIGISNENTVKIFDQFFREENSIKGVGLGLSIAQAIAKAHHGEITVESVPSQGTTFTVILPLKRSPALVLSQ